MKTNKIFNNKKAHHELGWAPYAFLAAAVAIVIAWVGKKIQKVNKK